MNLIVDKSTKCLCCEEVIPSKGWKYAAVTDTPQGTLVFCCSACRLEAGFGGTGRICSVIPEGAPIPNRAGGSYSGSSKNFYSTAKFWWIVCGVLFLINFMGGSRFALFPISFTISFFVALYKTFKK